MTILELHPKSPDRSGAGVFDPARRLRRKYQNLRGIAEIELSNFVACSGLAREAIRQGKAYRVDTHRLPALGRFDRITFLDGATPIQRLFRLEQTLGSEARGVRLFVKRDDLMASAAEATSYESSNF